jgi:hypothetical protein
MRNFDAQGGKDIEILHHALRAWLVLVGSHEIWRLESDLFEMRKLQLLHPCDVIMFSSGIALLTPRVFLCHPSALRTLE